MVNIKEEVADSQKNLINIAKGIGIALFITIVLIFIFSLILTYTKLPESFIGTGVIVITGISILISSILSNMHIKKSGLINGSIIGIIYILALYLLSSIFGANFSVNGVSIIMMFVSVLLGALGGIIGVNFKK